MIGAIYSEFVEHPSIPGGRATVGMPRGKSMTLTSDGWKFTFRSRRACVEWMLEKMPGATIWAYNGEVSVCGGSVEGMAKRAGIKTGGVA